MGPILETDRLILRIPVEADFDDGWAEFHADAVCMRYLGGAMPRSIAWRALAQVVGMWSLRGYGQFSAIEKESGRWVGRVGPWRPEGWPAAEIGWMFSRAVWGKGYATEASLACMAFAATQLKWARVAHMIHPGNSASQAVARRLGSAFIRDVKLPEPFESEPMEMWGQSLFA